MIQHRLNQEWSLGQNLRKNEGNNFDAVNVFLSMMKYCVNSVSYNERNNIIDSDNSSSLLLQY